MPDVTYEIVEHDGGWADKVNGVFSEPFPTHAEALAAAQVAAGEQEIPGHKETIEYEDDQGKWHGNRQRSGPAPYHCQRQGLSQQRAWAQRQFALRHTGT
jgi:Uncharacterized protein conserved in bacteria (DUF2188)